MNLSLKNFKIDIVFTRDDGKRSFIPLTVYENKISNSNSTYDEKLTEKANSQYSLSFNIELFINGQRNQYVDYLVNDRILRLTMDDSEIIEFVITSRQPTFSNKGLCYNISCQDYFSYQLSKQQVDINFSTMDENLWGVDIGPKSLDQLVNKVLEISNISNWRLNPNMNDYMLQFPDDLYDPKGKLLVSLELTNTTPYNILIEIAKLFNAIMIPDYTTTPHNINFYNKERIEYKGLRLYPDINLSNFSYNDKGDNLYNVIHVTGGEDAEGNYVSIVPSMPLSVGKILIETSKINPYTTAGDIGASLPQFSWDDYNTAPDFMVELNLTYDDNYTVTTDANSSFVLEVNYDTDFHVLTKILIYTGNADLTTDRYLAEVPFEIIDNKIIARATMGQANTTYKIRLVYGNYYLFQKPSLTNSGTNITYLNIDSNNSKFWEDCSSIKAVGQLIYNLYLSLNSGMILEYANETLYYFKDLEKIPQVSSALYNFDYWKNNGLLTTQRYNKLQNMLNVDLRNINLLLAAYSQIYNKMNYELNKMIDQEEELCAMMAAESEFKAFYEEANDEVSADALYVSNCHKYTRRETVNNQTKISYEYYLDIGCTETDSTEDGSERKTTVHYGKAFGGSYIGHQLPELSALSNSDGELLELYCFINETPYSLSNDYTINTSDYTIDINWDKTADNAVPTNTAIYVLYKTTGKNENVHLLDRFSTEGASTLNIDSLCDNTISKYNNDLQKLWNSTYQYYQRMIYGNQWCQTKISEVMDMITIKTQKQTTLVNNLVSIFGSNWRSITTEALQGNMSAAMEYNDLVNQLTSLGVYIGGTGKRVIKDSNPQTFYTYKGWYNYYLESLEALREKIDYDSTESECLSNIIQSLNTKKEEWEDRFYGEYNDIIRETKYSDSDQIDSAGLYAAAYRQFLQYQNPTKSYGASYISTESLQNVGSEVRVGDLIEILHEHLNEEISPNRLKITVDASYIKYTDRCMVRYKELQPASFTNINIGSEKYLFYDYIQSTGNQYIDTEYSWTSDDTSILVDMSIPDSSTGVTLWGNQPELTKISGFLHRASAQDNFKAYVGGTRQENTNITSLQDRTQISFTTKNNKFSINTYNIQGNQTVHNNQQNYTGSVKTGGNIVIFANCYQNNVTEYATGMKLYRFKMYDNGKMVRDFVPCHNVSQDKIGLYDLIEKKFYPGQGSSPFTLGTVLTDKTASQTLINLVSDSVNKVRMAKIHDIYKNQLIIEINNNTINTANPEFNINQHEVLDIKIGDITYNFSPKGPHILNIEKLYDTKPVQLRVTGVTKDLRGATAQLTVEENTLYNTLIDRLVYMLQH